MDITGQLNNNKMVVMVAINKKFWITCYMKGYFLCLVSGWDVFCLFSIFPILLAVKDTFYPGVAGLTGHIPVQWLSRGYHLAVLFMAPLASASPIQRTFKCVLLQILHLSLPWLGCLSSSITQVYGRATMIAPKSSWFPRNLPWSPLWV